MCKQKTQRNNRSDHKDSACPTYSFKFVKEGHEPTTLTLFNEFKCFGQLWIKLTRVHFVQTI